MKRLLLSLAVVVAILASGGCAMLMEGAGGTYGDPQSPSELYERALAQHQAGRYAEAKELFHQYIGQYPDTVLSEVALYYLGHCYQMLGDFKEAKVFYSSIIDRYGDDDFWGDQAMKRLRQIKEAE